MHPLDIPPYDVPEPMPSRERHASVESPDQLHPEGGLTNTLGEKLKQGDAADLGSSSLPSLPPMPASPRSLPVLSPEQANLGA